MIVLLYHNIVAHPPNAFNILARKEWVEESEFARQMAVVAERFRVIPLREVAGAVRRGHQIPDACAITFDDGYLGSYLHGLPVLERHGLPATFFVATQQVRGQAGSRPDRFDRLEAVLQNTTRDALDLTDLGFGVVSLDCDGCRLRFLRRFARRIKLTPPLEGRAIEDGIWERSGVPEASVAEYLSHEAYQLMSWEEMEDLVRRGFEIGSHSRTHASLSQVDAEELDAEVRGSLLDVRERLDLREVPFAYPYGKSEHVSSAAVAAVRRAGYSCGVVTKKEGITSTTDVYQIPRMGFRDVKRLFRVAGKSLVEDM